MRVLLTGSTGRLGGAFFSLWGAADSPYDVINLTRADADLADAAALRAVLEQIWNRSPFDAIVNPAALSGLEQCLDFPEQAQQVNVDSPKVMAEFCQEKGIRMVHFSTDYVFGGQQEGRLCEGDVTDPVNVYGKSKRAGELAVLAASPDSLVCRVSWLFGPATAKSHFDHVLDRALSGDEQNLISDKFSIPTFTHDIVEWVELLLGNKKSGIYHLCNSGDPESWYSYAETVCRLAREQGHPLPEVRLIPSLIKDADFFREPRPVHTAMLPQRLHDEGLVTPRHWMEAAHVYLKIR
ncbi:spore coat polysaccharide biosynthesis protein SpsK [Oceaniferula spumae]|uniref:dTDP-4-dehydrorhamnose reductase n=1 Tax=Oceaniferula spumae TaxID=2979115 RepID=A0AAT9FP59_9BACT